jgi:hypothetical protein
MLINGFSIRITALFFLSLPLPITFKGTALLAIYFIHRFISFLLLVQIFHLALFGAFVLYVY